MLRSREPHISFIVSVFFVVVISSLIFYVLVNILFNLIVEPGYKCLLSNLRGAGIYNFGLSVCPTVCHSVIISVC